MQKAKSQLNHKRLSVRETAERLGISERTIYNQLSQKIFPIKVKRFGRSIGFLERDVNRFLEDL